MQQMLQARVHNLRSGWQTMFKVLSAASPVLTGKGMQLGKDFLVVG